MPKKENEIERQNEEINELKKYINKINEENNYNGKNIITCLQEIEDQINDSHDKIFDLAPIEENLNNIVKSITPSYVAKEKEKMMNEIDNCKKRK